MQICCHRATSPQKSGQLSLPDVLFEGHGCVGPRLAQPTPLCFSPDRSDTSCHQTNQGTKTQSYFSGPALEESAPVLRAVSAAHRSPMAHSPETGPPLSGEQNDMASKARAVGSAPLASRWVLADLPESVQNRIIQARAPSTRHLYALKWSVFAAWCLSLAQTQFPVTYR